MPRRSARHKKPPAKPRRAKGTGSHFWSPTLKLYVGRVTIAGHRYERRAATVHELNAKLASIAPPGPTTTVAEWCERWYSSLSVRPSTKGDYRHTLDRFILPTLGHVRVAMLTAHDIEAASAKWPTLPRKDRRGRTVPGNQTGNTLRKNLAMLRGILEAARRARLITENPARDARQPRRKKVTIDPFTADELARIIASPGAGIYALLASVGCRIGEAIALDVSDFDAELGTISITKTYDRAHGTRPPKSENGKRVVRVPAPALPAIRTAAGSRKRGPLFLSRVGGRREHTSVRQSFARLCVRLGIRPRRPHQMRHAVATVLVSAGVPLGDAAAFLGDRVSTLVDTYLHAVGSDPAATLEKVFGG